jgi:hypothetical protein
MRVGRDKSWGMKSLTIALIASGIALPIGAQSSDLELQLVAARDTVWRAFFRNDTALLHRYIPPAAATAEGAAAMRWSTRDDIMAAAGFASSKSRLIDVTFENTQIVSSGHSALVQSNYQVIIESGERRDTTRGRATELFVRQGTTWVNPYWQLEQGAIGAAREIALPDTLGANFAIADSAKAAGTLADYDTLLGTWEFKFQARRPDGGYWPAFTGHWTFDKKPGGGLIEDRWRPDDPSTPMAQSLYTYRTFDPKRNVWQMIGSSSKGGEIQPGLTWSDGASRYAIQRDRGVLTRIRYLSISADSFLWRSDRSNDGGKTWQLDAAMMEARRIAK